MAGCGQSPIPSDGTLDAATSYDEIVQAGESRVFDGMEFVWGPAGEFLMGSPSPDARVEERPVRRVRISRGFWLGKYEVTQGEWQRVMGSNPSSYAHHGSNNPVENVSWDDVQKFIVRLNTRAGGSRYRLPTEAEWEYAARAGTTEDRYSESVDAIAWHYGNSRSRPHPVGRKVPNAWGLHDMLGNVREWVRDWDGDDPSGSMTDPQGPASGSYRVYRGPGFHIDPPYCRVTVRDSAPPSFRTVVGFRLLRTG